MASTNGVIFPESMADFLANPVDIRFGSIPAESIAPAACLVIEGNAVTTDQQIKTDLSSESHPPAPSDLIVGINRVEDMLSNTIKVCERIKRPRRTSSPSCMPLGLRNAAHVASCYMKRKIQIESGLKTQDRGSCRSHLEEPCPIRENPKHTAHQCHVLKKLRRSLTAAHCRRQLNRESSPDHLAFQITRTTISPNYPGEEFENLDREILVVFADVPPQDGETDEQRQERENANAARAVRRQQEIAAAAPGAGQQPGQQPLNVGQVNANAGQQAPAAPAAPQQRRHDDPPRANRLRARGLLKDFERDGFEVYNSPQTNSGATLAALNHLEDSLAVRRIQANIRIAAAQIEERGPRYNRSAASSYSRSRSECPRQRRRSQGPLELVGEEGRGEIEVVQPVNPVANVVANAPANPIANAAGNIANNVANSANI
jgi:hypothetical protein